MAVATWCLVLAWWLNTASLAAMGLDDPPADRDAAAATGPALAAVSALEDAMVAAVARAETSVVAISRFKRPNGSSDNEVTTAIKGLGRLSLLNDRGGGDFPQGFGDLEGVPGDARTFDSASGVTIGPRGEILTAFHVIKGAQRLMVIAPGEKPFAAEIIAADPRSDLAVIVPREMAGRPLPKLTPLPLGDATKLRKGSFLIALGNAYNAAFDGKASASLGILSNVARRIDAPPFEPRNNVKLYNLPTLLQLDAKLNQGMSGGAVINLKGELVGLTTAAANPTSLDAQAGYAIPLDALGRKIVETLMAGREVEYGFLGIGLDLQGTNRVDRCEFGTPAAEGGLLVDDRILAVGEIAVNNADELVLAVSAQPVGEPVKLKIERNGQPLSKSVVLAKRRVEGEIIATNRPAPWRGLRVDYTTTLAAFDAQILEMMARPGVGVVEVQPGSPAAKAGLKVGQVIDRVGKTPVRTPADFLKAVKEVGGPVSLGTDLGTIEIK